MGDLDQVRRQWSLLLARIARKVFEVGEEPGWRPTSTSVFEEDRVVRDISAPYASGIPLIVATLDYLNGLVTLLDGKHHVWAPYPVARSCVETASRAWWMLDPQQSSSVRNRRAYELLRVAIYANRGSSDSFGRVRDGFEAYLRSELTNHGIGFVVRGGRIASIEEVKLPGSLELSSAVLGDDDFAADAYGWLSGVGHGGLDVLRESMRSHAIDAQRSRIVFAPNASDVSVAAYCASVAALAMFDRWVALCSWEPEWESWSRYFHGRAGELVTSIFGSVDQSADDA